MNNVAIGRRSRKKESGIRCTKAEGGMDGCAPRVGPRSRRIRRLPSQNDGRADSRGVVELSRFPIRQPHTAMRSWVSRQMTRVQSVPWLKLQEERHRRANKPRTARLGCPSHIHIRTNDSSASVNIVSVQSGAMINVLSNDAEAPRRCAIPLAASGYPRRRHFITSPV
jgi:hypothetical protein